MYSTPWCPFCVRAKRLLEAKQADYTDVDLAREPGRRAEMMERSGQRTVPQIWIAGQHVGGCDELYALERAGKLDELLDSNN